MTDRLYRPDVGYEHGIKGSYWSPVQDGVWNGNVVFNDGHIETNRDVELVTQYGSARENHSPEDRLFHCYWGIENSVGDTAFATTYTGYHPYWASQ